MQAQFVDRTLICADCHQEFIFTAGEQLFFSDKQFKNDPRRCKPCKTRRAGLAAVANGTTPPHQPPRTETRTQCSECGIETTVPFKPTQGRPVLCRHCFQLRGRAAQQPAAVAQALTTLSETPSDILSPEAAVVAAASVATASPASSVATPADLAALAPAPLVPHTTSFAALPPLATRPYAAQPFAPQQFAPQSLAPQSHTDQPDA